MDITSPLGSYCPVIYILVYLNRLLCGNLPLQVLTGDRDTILALTQELSLPWYSYLIAVLLYSEPFAKVFTLQERLAVSS